MNEAKTLAELLNTASAIINEMVVTENRDDGYELALAFKKIRRSFAGNDELELFPIERRSNGSEIISGTTWAALK